MENIINKMENKKGLIIIGIFLIFLSVVGATFAYWGWYSNESQWTNVNFVVIPNVRPTVANADTASNAISIKLNLKYSAIP